MMYLTALVASSSHGWAVCMTTQVRILSRSIPSHNDLVSQKTENHPPVCSLSQAMGEKHMTATIAIDWLET